MLKRGCGYVTLWSARSFPESRGHILLSPNLWLGGGGGGGGTRLWFFTLDLPRCRLRVVTHSQEHKSTPLLLMGSSRALPGADLEDVVLMDESPPLQSKSQALTSQFSLASYFLPVFSFPLGFPVSFY